MLDEFDSLELETNEKSNAESLNKPIKNLQTYHKELETLSQTYQRKLSLKRKTTMQEENQDQEEQVIPQLKKTKDVLRIESEEGKFCALGRVNMKRKSRTNVEKGSHQVPLEQFIYPFS